MIDYFYDYIRKIIIFLIFTSFIQVIIPSNKYKSYINLVFGMMLIFIMVQPINSIYAGIKNMDFLNIMEDKDFVTPKIDGDMAYKQIQDEVTLDFFNSNIKSQIQNIIHKDYKVLDASVTLKEDKYKKINITKIEIEISNTQNSIYVKPFNEEETKDDKQINKIKKVISNFYDIDVENIFIKNTR